MLKHLISNAANNANKVPQARKHMEIIKKLQCLLSQAPWFLIFATKPYNVITMLKDCTKSCLLTVQYCK